MFFLVWLEMAIDFDSLCSGPGSITFQRFDYEFGQKSRDVDLVLGDCYLVSASVLFWNISLV